MFGSAHRERIERKLDAVLTDLAALQKRVVEIEGQEFALVELRRQARNAVRSLERAAANAQEARQGTNGDGAGIPVPPGVDPISARILARRGHRGLPQRDVP